MSIVSSRIRLRESPSSGGAADGVRRQVRALLAGGHIPGVERRESRRYPFPHLVHLTPLAADGTPLTDETVVVISKDLSETGLGFYHQQPLACRKAIVSLEAPGGGWVAFSIDIKWCRFTTHAWYDSGGSFIEAAEPIVRRSTRAAAG